MNKGGLNRVMILGLLLLMIYGLYVYQQWSEDGPVSILKQETTQALLQGPKPIKTVTFEEQETVSEALDNISLGDLSMSSLGENSVLNEMMA